MGIATEGLKLINNLKINHYGVQSEDLYPDLVFLDIGMPKGSGFNLLEMFRGGR